MNSEESDAHLDLVMAYRSAGDPTNAWAQLRLLQTEFAENDPRLLYVQGLLVSDQGRSALAIDSLRALAQWKKLEALDRKVRSQEVAYDMARAAHWEDIR